MATTVHNLVYFDKLIVTCSVSMRPFSVSEIAHKTSLKALSALYNSANSFARNSAKSTTGLHCCTPLHQAVLHCAKKSVGGLAKLCRVRIGQWPAKWSGTTCDFMFLCKSCRAMFYCKRNCKIWWESLSRVKIQRTGCAGVKY